MKRKISIQKIKKVFDFRNKPTNEKDQLIDFVKNGLQKECLKEFTEAVESSNLVLIDTQFIFYKANEKD